MKVFKITAICSAVLLGIAANGVYAQDNQITSNITVSQSQDFKDLNLNLSLKETANTNAFEVRNNGSDVTSNLTGKNIAVSLNDHGLKDNHTKDSTIFTGLRSSSYHSEGQGIDPLKVGSSIINVGDKNTDNINISLNTKSTNTTYGDGNNAVGVLAYKQYANGPKPNNNTNYQTNTQSGGVVNLNATNLNIDVQSKGEAVGIFVQNSTTQEKDASKLSTVNINAQSTHINTHSDTANGATGLYALSQGRIFANSGDLYINADNAILTRGNSLIEINKDKNHTVQLNGDFNFNYDAKTSGTDVDSTVIVNLSGANSFWNGNALTSYQADGKPEGDAMQVKGLNLSISDNAKWNVGVIDDSKDHGATAIAINKVTLDDGIINVTQNNEQKVTIDSLEGTGGNINLIASAKQDGSLTSSKVTVNSIAKDNAPVLNVGFVGINADDIKDDKAAEGLFDNAINGQGESSLTQNSTIDEGDLHGAISQSTNADGSKGEIVHAKNSKIEAFNNMSTLAYSQWRHETSSLTKRLGEIRHSPKSIGLWTRVYGSEYELGNDEMTYTNNSLELGFDTDVGYGFKVGAAVSYTDGKTSALNGNADNDIYSLGLYGTYLAENGIYVDLTGKFSKISNDFTYTNFSGDYDNNAYSFGIETGWNFKLNDSLFIEPQAQFIYGKIVGDDFTASNGVTVSQDEVDAKLLRGGLRAGFNFPEDMGLVYAKASVVHDFDGKAEFTAAKDGDFVNMNSDLGGTWCEYGLGANINWSKNTYTYVELEKTTGGDLEENYRWNIGIRHNF